MSSDMVVASINVMDNGNPELKGRMFSGQYKIESGKAAEAFSKATKAMQLMVESFWMDTEEKAVSNEEEQLNTKNPQVEENDIKIEANPREIALSIQKALSNEDVAKEYKKLQQPASEDEETTAKTTKTITIPTGNKALTDMDINNNYSQKELITGGNESGSIKNQLINVNFTPEQAEVVIDLLEENQKKYEPKSSMFGLLGEVMGKMLRALSKKLDQVIDADKITSEKLNSLYSAINNEDIDKFRELYRTFEQKVKYCHDFICEAAHGATIQSTDIINHILYKEKVPVSIRTLQNAFVTAIDNNIDSALSIYKYSDANLHGEAQFDTMRGFLSHELTTLPDTEAEKFIKSSSNALDDTVVFKEMIRAEKYGLLNSGLMQCRNIDEHAPALFYFAAHHKDADAMHTLISRGANVNSNNGEALYACYETNKLEAAKVLINYGADINYLTNYISQIKDARPDIHFIQELYKHCGITENALDNKLQSGSEIDEAVGEYGEIGVFDGSWE
ncbi:ankyrin repeat domain-containing protein [Ruminiclostridium papyrosolvens]|uniref:ankyrin repeat domain-containing protein n=1 Tax=Ruminiclostridium papyrosolvens TaxID=29362 RepID=UPI001FA7DF12|nr:ankyrin repeat domain-containing protein [Ruminiclostridium papyrosolvens]